MVDAEERYTRFKQKNLAFLAEEDSGYYTRLQDAKQRFSQAELELKIQKDRLNVLRQQVEGEVPSFGIVPEEFSGGASSELDPRIASMESMLDELLLRYTERHPDVVAVRKTLDDLKNQREQELVALKYGAGFTNRAIAGLTGLTESNVGTILYRIVHKLRAQWEANDER